MNTSAPTTSDSNSLQLASTQYSRFLEAALDEIFVLTPNWRLEYVNRATATRLGVDPALIIGRHIDELFPPNLIAATHQQVDRVLATQAPAYSEDHLTFPDGSEGWKSAWFVPLKAAGGEIQSVMCIARDITARKRIEIELLDSREGYKRIADSISRLRQAVDASAEIIFMTDAHGLITFVNQQFERVYGYSSSEVVGHATPRILRSGTQPAHFYESFWRRLMQGETLRHEFLNRAKDGRLIAVDAAVSPIWNGTHTEMLGHLAIQRDISERKQWEEELRRKNLVLATEHDSTLDGILVVDENNKVLSRNGQFATMWNLRSEEVTSDDSVDLMHAILKKVVDPELIHQRLLAIMDNRYATAHEEIDLIDGRTFDRYTAPMRDADGQYYGRVWFYRDVSAMKLNERNLLDTQEQLRHDSLHDRLTGLPNRGMLHDRLTRALATTRRHADQLFGLLFVDLDNFKLINDSLGHEAGDELLVAWARRLESCLRREDMLTRLGGDEFVVLTGPLASSAEVCRVAERILAQLRSPFSIAGRQITVTASIGLTDSSDPEATTEGLLRDADTAMYAAKRCGKNRYQVFTPNLHAEAMRRLELEHELRLALDRGEFVLHYQPIVDVRTGAVSAFEALLRWQHPTRGLLRPPAFLAVAEEIGLTLPIGEWALRTACRDQTTWSADGQSPIRVAANISPRQFHDAGLSDMVERVLRDTNVRPSDVELELSENIVLSSEQSTTAQLDRLAKLGVRISVDDFGVVHTSIRYLATYPISTLKIDQSFIRDIAVGRAGAVVMKSLIGLGHSLGLNVVVEGVETAEQERFVRDCGCDEIQGFYMGLVLPQEEAVELARARLLRSLADAENCRTPK
jgi:diguanylate cyclase (GGDEF)-like protein/PAS domain S-box-containing protein